MAGNWPRLSKPTCWRGTNENVEEGSPPFPLVQGADDGGVRFATRLRRDHRLRRLSKDGKHYHNDAYFCRRQAVRRPFDTLKPWCEQSGLLQTASKPRAGGRSVDC